MSLLHVAPTDEVMAIEVGRTLAIIEAIDAGLARRSGEPYPVPLSADAADQLVPAQVRKEMESLRDTVDGWIAVAAGAEAVGRLVEKTCARRSTSRASQHALGAGRRGARVTRPQGPIRSWTHPWRGGQGGR